MLPTRILRAAQGSKGNITGFNLRAFKQAAGQPRYDPWERTEAWRYTGTFSRWNRFKSALPGLGTGSAAFAVYLVYDYIFAEEEHHHGEEHH